MTQFITPIGEQDIRTISSVQGGVPLGAITGTTDGRVYRFGLAGATTLDPGKVATTPAVAANHINRTNDTARNVGDTVVSFPLGATAATADQYANGYLTVNSAGGAGVSYLIEGNNAAASSGTITVALSDPLKVALTTSSKVSLNVNPYSGLIISASAVALQAVGVPNVSVTNAYYGWFQVSGYCSVLSDGVISKGAGAIISDAVNGAVEIEVAGTVTQRIGTAPEATVDTEYRLLNLTLQ